MTDLALHKPSHGSTAATLLHFVVFFLLLCLLTVGLGLLDSEWLYRYGVALCLAIWLGNVVPNVQSAKRPADRSLSFKLWRRGIREDLEEDIRPYKSWRGITRKLVGGFWYILHICLGIVLAAVITGSLNAVFFIIPSEFNILLIQDADSYLEIDSPEFLVPGILLFVLASAFGSLAAFEDPVDGRGRWRRIRDHVGKRWAIALLWQFLIASTAGLALFGILVALILGAFIGVFGSDSMIPNPVARFVLEIMLLSLAGAVVLLASHRGLAHRYADSFLKVTQEGAADGRMAGRAKSALFIALLLIGIAATTVGQARTIRAVAVTKYVVFPMLAYVAYAWLMFPERITAIGKSYGRHLSTEELVAELNEQGQWSPKKIEQGFLDRSPEDRERLFETLNISPEDRETYLDPSGDLQCTMAVAAGTLSKQEIGTTAQLDPAMGAMSIKYCLKFECRSARLGADELVTILSSSHASERDGWDRTVSLFFDWIPASGGFCTATGDLADGYRG